jgi:hypothetical protein
MATNSHIDAFGISMDDSNNLYMANDNGNRINKITPSGYIYTVAGTGVEGFSGDGDNANSAEIASPENVVVGPCGNLYIEDFGNQRVRKVTFNVPDTSNISISGITSSPIGGIVNLTATVSGAGGSYTIQWYDNGVLLTTTTVPSVSFTKVNTIDTITARVIPSGPCNVASVSAAHVVTTGTTGFDEQVFNNATIQIYPSPASNAVNITGLNIFSVAVCDLMGRVVYEDKTLPGTQASISVTVAQYPAGIYLVKVNGVCSGRFVKE